jgi:hypothetical protein
VTIITVMAVGGNVAQLIIKRDKKVKNINE